MAAIVTATTSVDEQLRRLMAFQPDGHPVVSCYLKLEPRDRTRGKYLVKMKNRIKSVTEGLGRLGFDRAQQEAVGRDLARIQEYLSRQENLPAARGVAIFACEGREMFETVPMPVVYRARLAVDRSPLIRELAAVEDEFGRILMAVVDRTSARLFAITAYGAEELVGLRPEASRTNKFRGADGSGWGEHTFHNRLREEKQRHFDSVARELFTIDRRQPAHAIVLAGTGPEAEAVKPFLHPYLAERLIGYAKLAPKLATPATAHEAALMVRADYERELERRTVAEIGEAVGSGWAVNGVAATLKALSIGQVRVLVVRADAFLPGFRCGDSGRLTLSERDCGLEGEAVPVLDVVDDALEEALRQGIDINVVFEEEAAEQVDGLAALLRFR